MAVVAVALAQQRMEVLAVSEAAVVLLIFIILAAEEALAVVGVAVPILGKAEAGAVVAAEVEVVAVQMAEVREGVTLKVLPAPQT